MLSIIYIRVLKLVFQLKRITLNITLVFSLTFAYSQSPGNDLNLIAKANQVKEEMRFYNADYGNSSEFLSSEKKSIWHKLNPLKYVFGSLMYMYQNLLSPQISSGCPYRLTCSNFGKRSIEKFGILKGVLLSADRLMRCNHGSISELPLVHIGKDYKIHDNPDWYKVK